MSGSDKRMEHFFKASYQNVYDFLLKRLGSSADAEDAAQETFLRLAHQDIAAMDSPLSYLYAMARNLATDMLRTRKLRSNVVTSPAIEDYPSAALPTDMELDQARRQKQILTALEGLPLRCREAFILHRFDNLTYREIARQMSISPKTVEKHIAKAIVQISAQLSSSD